MGLPGLLRADTPAAKLPKSLEAEAPLAGNTIAVIGSHRRHWEPPNRSRQLPLDYWERKYRKWQ